MHPDEDRLDELGGAAFAHSAAYCTNDYTGAALCLPPGVRRGLVIILSLAMSFPVAAAENQSEQSAGRQQQSFTPSLAVVMGLIQISHFRLWLAGNVRNWPLAEYGLTQMNATLQEARALFPNVPAADTSAMSADELRDAIKSKSGAKFDAAFKKFTSECNSCHERLSLGFIKIRVPATSPIMTSPLSNQWFEPDQTRSLPARR